MVPVGVSTDRETQMRMARLVFLSASASVTHTRSCASSSLSSVRLKIVMVGGTRSLSDYFLSALFHRPLSPALLARFLSFFTTATYCELVSYRPLSRRLDRCDRVIHNESGDPNGGNMCSFSGATCTSRVRHNADYVPYAKSALIYRRGLRQRVASLTLNCNGDFAIRAYSENTATDVIANRYRPNFRPLSADLHRIFQKR